MANIKINYEDSFVAFLDVLGFKELVFNNPDNTEKLEEYFSIVDDAIKKDIDDVIDKMYDIDSIIISDSIILRIKKKNDNDDNIEQLRKLCLVVGKMQLRLANKDIWIRGAISSGKVHFDSNNNQVVGPAFINAYLLEEQLAIVPRIILDNKIINELDAKSADELIRKMDVSKKTDHFFYGKKILYIWEINTTLKKDIPLIIDYATLAVENKATLNNIIDNIENNIYCNTALYAKYKWVAEYFLSVCKRDVALKEYKEEQLEFISDSVRKLSAL